MTANNAVKNHPSQPSSNDQQVDIFLPSMERETTTLLQNFETQTVPIFAEAPGIEITYVEVPQGEIRVLHHHSKDAISVRPLVFVPGWGVAPSGFQDWFEIVYQRAEFYFIETREKGSSRMHRWKTQFTMAQMAYDIQLVLKHFDLDLPGRDFILMGPCWGASVILQGLMDQSLNAPTIVTVDPMHALWFAKWALKWVAPILPAWLFYFLRPLIRWFKLRNMHEPTQKRRAVEFINSAVLWKWLKAAHQCRDFEIFGNVGGIEREVFVVNGTNDAIHDKRDYPKIAAELPRGRYIGLETGEENRERLMGVISLLFSQVTHEEGLPGELAVFEGKNE